MDRRGLLGLVGLMGVGLGVACARRSAPSPSRRQSRESQESSAQPVHAPQCFDVVAGDNSTSTRDVFTAKRCQGGGVTWAAIINVLVQECGPSKTVEAETPGWTGDVRALSWKGKTVRVAVDDEGDSARFCTDSGPLLAEVRSAVARLNAHAAELERTMGKANPLALECFPDGASVSTLLSGMAPPPSPPPAEARAR